MPLPLPPLLLPRVRVALPGPWLPLPPRHTLVKLLKIIGFGLLGEPANQRAKDFRENDSLRPFRLVLPTRARNNDTWDRRRIVNKIR
jgi:hypothetical protein